MTSTERPTQQPRINALERELALGSWLERRSFSGDRWSVGDLLALKRETVTVVLPAREVAGTIASVVGGLAPLREAGLIDELVVVDAGSDDGTAVIAAAHGATVFQEDGLMAEFGPAQGKGDAMWRGLAATSGDIVAYLDTDTENFDERFLLGLLGPLFEHPEVQLVKGAFRRPFKVGERAEPDGGGRVTELVARPFLNLYVPELAGFVQPLAGEIAARRPLLEALSYPVGYGIEIAMMIDAVRLVGIEAMAQSDLGVRQNRHQSLRALSAMAYAVLAAASTRVHGRDLIEALGAGVLALPDGGGVEIRTIALDERPPLRSLREAAGAGRRFRA